ncbi:hypothetical protein OUZ56_019416 [Daphnia magna]|uniref:Uncharacterized protein n=1 Tax=Daphnia magna TaxID=35525 RepID=A0ABQ9ZC51_9CRUS|nr:hypothetical protein OUZ56_019416 [Daphnia magna]
MEVREGARENTMKIGQNRTTGGQLKSFNNSQKGKQNHFYYTLRRARQARQARPKGKRRTSGCHDNGVDVVQ